MSKGSVQRPDDGAYAHNWDRIFKKKKPIPDYGELMLLDEFIEQCNYGCYTNDDGSGYYSDGEYIFPVDEAIPSDLVRGKINRSYTHVMWFNK